MAEQIGTLAAMASGPFVVQTGSGGGSAQFRAMGASLGDRGWLVEEGIAAVQALLRGETVSSARWSIAEARIAPLPQQESSGGSAGLPRSPSTAPLGSETSGTETQISLRSPRRRR